MNKYTNITKQLIAAQIIDDVVGMEFGVASKYEFQAEFNAERDAERAKAGAAVKRAEREVRNAKNDTDLAKAQAKLDAALAREAEIAGSTDPITDSKAVIEMLNIAFSSLAWAMFDELRKERPVMDSGKPAPIEVESSYNPETDGLGVDRIQPLSLPEAVRFASAVDEIATHYSRIAGNEWLGSMTRTQAVRNAAGEYVRNEHGNIVFETVTSFPVQTFKDWLADRVARSNPDDAWGVMFHIVKNSAFGEFELPHMDYITAREVLTEWLDGVPFTGDETDDSTRRERVLQRVGNRKWRQLLEAVAGLRDTPNRQQQRAIDKALRDWVWITFSPDARRDIAAIKVNPAYQQLLLQREMDALQMEAMKDETSNMLMELQLQRTELELGRKLREKAQADYLAQLQAKAAALGIK